MRTTLLIHKAVAGEATDVQEPGMQVSEGRAAHRPLNLDRVLQTPGARLDLDKRGDIVVRMPKQTRSFGLRLLAWFSQSPQHAAEHSRQKMSERYEVASLDRSPRYLRVQLKEGQVLSEADKAVNRALNTRVAHAFMHRMRLDASIENQARMGKHIFERSVELPPKVFASELAVYAHRLQAGGAQQRAGLLQRYRDVLAQALPRSVEVARRAPIIERAIELWNTDAVRKRTEALAEIAEAEVDPEPDAGALQPYLERAKAEANPRQVADIDKLARQLRKEGLANTPLASRIAGLSRLLGSDARTFKAELDQVRKEMAQAALDRPSRLQSASATLERALAVLRHACAEIQNSMAPSADDGVDLANGAPVPGPELRIALADAAAKTLLTNYGGDSAVDPEALRSVLRIASRAPDILQSLPARALEVLERQQQASGRNVDDVRPGDPLGALTRALLGQTVGTAPSRALDHALVLRTLGATVAVGADGEFEVHTPPIPRSNGTDDAEQRLRDRLSGQYTISAKSLSDRKRYTYQLRSDPGSSELAANQRRNGPVAEAFMSQVKALGSKAAPEHRARLAGIRERMTALPPEMFASQLATFSDAVWSGSSLHQNDLSKARESLVDRLQQLPRGPERDALVRAGAGAHGDVLTPAGEQMVRRAIDRWQDDVVAGLVAAGSDAPRADPPPFLEAELQGFRKQSS
jgi:hypothetical protein